MRDQDVFLERALLEEQLVTQDQIVAARRLGGEIGVDLTDALVRLEILSSRQIALTKAMICEAAFIDLADFEPCFANTSLVSRQLAERYTLFPLFHIDGLLTLVMDDPLDLEAADQVRQITKCDVDVVITDRQLLRSLINRAYSLSQSESGIVSLVTDEPQSATVNENSQPTIAAVNQILADAVELRASDIHINPDEHVLHLRYRIDGVLQERQGPPLTMHAPIVQRLKVMANLDLTQTRRPQDGKIRIRNGSVVVDVRMSTVPTVCGENVVLRLLSNQQVIRDLHTLGIPAPMAKELEGLLTQPYGMLLVTGPTGSGKTTTLYTALNKLNDPSSNILTIEDPVEIRLPYVRQIQVHPEIGLTFANALRSVLRQDPDVVLVGEIRDNETATIALQAALTGHLVLSTVHTNDAVGAIARLRDFGLPSFVINSALLGIVAQRLVRRVCTSCAVPAHVDALTRRRFGLESDATGFVEGKGCARCGQAGYRGRVGIYEQLTFNSVIRSLVEQNASVDRIRETAVIEGMRLMWMDGVEKARLGLTTLTEIARAAAVIDMPDQAVAEPSKMRVSA